MNTTSFDTVPVAKGVWLQLYRGAMKGRQLSEHLDDSERLRDEGAIAGVLLHGFPRELERSAESLVRMCETRRLPFAFSWGLDGSKDEDGTRLTVREKGECMGRVLAAHPRAWGLLDAEGQWDTDEGPADDMDEAGAIEMGLALRRLAPHAVLGDQPWPMPDQHGGRRSKPKPLEQGGVWYGFPLDEFASCVHFRAPQLYWTNWKQRTRYRDVGAWSEREWGIAERAMQPCGLVRPRTITVQGYGHEPDPWALVDALLARRDRPVVMWVNPSRDFTVARRALRVQRALETRGVLDAQADHRDAVKVFQRSAGLTADGWAGYDTMRALGV
jgi:hypothetical protein